jgi:6-phosphogluconolactonase (cycloisomerase 2 family)
MRRKTIFALTLLFGLTSFGQKSLIITHDDPFSNPNLPPKPDTLSTYAVQPDGSLLLIGSFPTGLNGAGGSGDSNGGGISFIPTRKIAVSGDNKFVYATGAPTNVISGFSIDGATGLLTLIPGSPFKTGAEACNGMGLATSPNGKFLYAASACGLAGPVPGGDPVVSAFSINPDGSLTEIGANIPIAMPLDMVVSGNGKFLLISTAPNAGGQTTITVFSIAADGSLSSVPGSPFQFVTTGISTALQIDCANHVFHGIDSSTSLVEVFDLGPQGTLTPIAGSPFTAIPQAPTSGGLVGSTLAQGGKVLVIADLFGFAESFTVGDDGAITQIGGQVTGAGQSDLGQMTVDSTGAFVYSRSINGIAAFSVDASGSLTNVPGAPFPSGNLASFGTMASFPVHQCAAAPALVNFGTFNAELEEKILTPPSFELEGSFTLSAASNGIAPANETITINAGGFTTTIPAGSFKMNSTGSFNFSGTIGGVRIEMSVTPSTTIKNKYSFEFEAAVDLSAAGSAVAVSLTIGDDTGFANVKPEIRTSK